MATITFLPAKDNLKMRRYKRNGEYYKQRNELKAKQKSRSVEEIWDSIIKPVDETDVLASLVLSLKSAPDTRKTLKLKKQPSSEFGVTAR
ncbi:hypothetical protein HF524_14155 [Proteus mirabilis]|uniref:hypothetical protein n=1 Tax=Proteus mirabilis TaxID=584 RepID=UPI000531B919|nr:hypothetical protein [Proteus mirabilis]EHZ8013178.1 hypothetical protein [Proteus mirabilis]EKU0925068.1 hypothetical protein [Proteus mirabilis]EKV2708315.1 hypothetical protein [Proteus mirabilis]KGQ17182.1 hypothetical protein NX82_03090 [Proteus mirabilis]MDF7127652.1 hypothetical protein [Proteus mirabilis]